MPSEEAIAREMRDTGLDRFPAIRRIQQRQQLREELAAGKRRVVG
jgi:hypothetical protein